MATTRRSASSKSQAGARQRRAAQATGKPEVDDRKRNEDTRSLDREAIEQIRSRLRRKYH